MHSSSSGVSEVPGGEKADKNGNDSGAKPPEKIVNDVEGSSNDVGGARKASGTLGEQLSEGNGNDSGAKPPEKNVSGAKLPEKILNDMEGSSNDVGGASVDGNLEENFDEERAH